MLTKFKESFNRNANNIMNVGYGIMAGQLGYILFNEPNLSATLASSAFAVAVGIPSFIATCVNEQAEMKFGKIIPTTLITYTATSASSFILDKI